MIGAPVNGRFFILPLILHLKCVIMVYACVLTELFCAGALLTNAAGSPACASDGR